MSLDVYLTMPEPVRIPGRSGIFIREGGQMKEITREEWDKRSPGVEPVAVLESEGSDVYWRNITHNLGKMAREAGIYEHLWRPDEIGVTKAGQLIAPLKDGLERLMTDPERYKKHNPENGWGDYDGLVEFVRDYQNACCRWPEADVRVSR